MKKPFLILTLILITIHKPVFCDDMDLQDNKKNGLFALPLAFYTPETSFGGGFAGIYYYSNSCKSLSSIRVLGIQTSFHQTIFLFRPDIHFGCDTYRFTGKFGFYLYPDRFYGIGDGRISSREDYTPQYGYYSFQLTKKVADTWHLGFLYEGLQYKLFESEKDGLLSKGTIIGTEPGGGYSSALGIACINDTRDDFFFPSRGIYIEGTYSAALPYFGSDKTFTDASFDFRKFLSINENHILAFQVYGKFMNGDIPFILLSQLGGHQHIRGYFEGRYRDKNMSLLQAEYRVALSNKINMVLFTGTGSVFSRLEDVSMSDFNQSFGAGLRYRISPASKINARLDIGFAKDETGVYARINEAF